MELRDDQMSALEEEIGTITKISEWCPGVFNAETEPGGCFTQDYFVVLDAAPMAAKVQNYGKKMNGFRLYAQNDDSSGWRVVQYETDKYRITGKKASVPEWIFRDMALHAMELHPEYFGSFPVPFHTPHGCTLRHRTLSNGIYWLETSKCRELLAVCHPIWDAELSFAAQMLCEAPARLMAAIQEKATDYIFFSKEKSCIPLYELMETRGEWDGTVIRCPALMNAIWECMPEYAMHVNGEMTPQMAAEAAALMPEPGRKALPEPCGERMIYMYPDAGTDFLMWD